METGVRGVPGRIIMTSAAPEATAQLRAGLSGVNLRDVHVRRRGRVFNRVCRLCWTQREEFCAVFGPPGALQWAQCALAEMSLGVSKIIYEVHVAV